MKKLISSILIIIFVLTQTAHAHPPSSVKADYDPSNNRLSVVVTHLVGNPEEHYIAEIKVIQNGRKIASKEFFEQANDTEEYATFTLSNINTEEVIVIEARCNISGTLKKEVNIGKSPESVPAEKPLKDGRFIVKNDMMDVAVTIESGKIRDIEILQHRGGGEAYADMILPLIGRIIEKQSTEVEAITGATVSSNALKEAVEEAIKQAQDK